MKKIVVVHSGGMDSSICLRLAIEEYGAEHVQSISFYYHQRHEKEIEQAKIINRAWGTNHKVVEISSLREITTNALLDRQKEIEHTTQIPNTFVLGRNGLFARLAAIYAVSQGIHSISMGVIAVEGSYSHYPDCSREYINSLENILKIDLECPHFSILTPLVHLSKMETLEIAHNLHVLPFLLRETITCYQGVSGLGCQKCPACILRNQGLRELQEKHSLKFSF